MSPSIDILAKKLVIFKSHVLSLMCSHNDLEVDLEEKGGEWESGH